MESKLNIIYENDDYLVVEKEAGITVNNAETTGNEKTLQDLIDESGKIKKDGGGSDFNKRSGIVHRLDKETSGVIVIAKNPDSFIHLQNQFKERRVGKSYLALVHGSMFPSSGEISAPVGRLPWNRKRFGVIAGGREAVTRYKVLSVFGSRLSDHSESVVGTPVRANRQLANQNRKTDNRKPITEYYSLVRLHPKTGRTHQIRVHLKYINHSIFSDPLYGGRKTSREDRKLLPRFFLHAEKISFFDPKTEKKVSYESDLPHELKALLEKLKLKKDNS